MTIRRCLLTDSRPAEIDGYRSARGLPVAIGVVLVLLLVATLTHVLVSTMRRRAADLAVLRAIGSSSRNLVATLRWQALVLTGSAILIGLPLGLIASRIRVEMVQLLDSASHRARSRRSSIPALAAIGLLALAWLLATLAGLARPEHRSPSPFQRAVAHRDRDRVAPSIILQARHDEAGRRPSSRTSHVGLAVVCSVAAAFSYGAEQRAANSTKPSSSRRTRRSSSGSCASSRTGPVGSSAWAPTWAATCSRRSRSASARSCWSSRFSRRRCCSRCSSAA